MRKPPSATSDTTDQAMTMKDSRTVKQTFAIWFAVYETEKTGSSVWIHLPHCSKPENTLPLQLCRSDCTMSSACHLSPKETSIFHPYLLKHQTQKTGWWNIQSIERWIPGLDGVILWFETNRLPDLQFSSPHTAGRLSHKRNF